MPERRRRVGDGIAEGTGGGASSGHGMRRARRGPDLVTMEEVVSRENMCGLPASGGQQGSAGRRRDDRRRTDAHCCERVGRRSGRNCSTARTSPARAEGGNPEARRQGRADAGHSDGSRSTDPTGPAAGAATAGSIRRSRTAASASVRGAVPIRRWIERGSTSRPATAGWSTWTWRSSSTA